MDSIKGAIELRELLEKLGTGGDEHDAAPVDVPPEAPPLYHWLRIVPSNTEHLPPD